MTGSALQQLAWHMPPASQDVRRRQVRPTRVAGVQGLIDYDTEIFLDAYVNLHFGWDAAVTLAANHIRFPCTLEGDDEVIYRAYLHNCDPRYFDQHIWEAQMLKRRDMEHQASLIEALLLVADSTHQKIAEQLNIAVETVCAYEKLFFNILDRRQDSMFVARVVYPNGRMVETLSTYIDDEPLSRILKRCGFNRGAFEVLHWAGFGGGMLQSLANSSTPAQLESLIMANGYLLASSGWINQQHNAIGLNRATSLLAAAKQGGEDTAPTSPMASMGAILIKEIQQAKFIERDAQLKLRTGIREESTKKKNEAKKD